MMTSKKELYDITTNNNNNNDDHNNNNNNKQYIKGNAEMFH